MLTTSGDQIYNCIIFISYVDYIHNGVSLSFTWRYEILYEI